MWNRWVILLSSYLSSAIGLLYPLVIANFFGIDYVSLWVGTRAVVQLTLAFLPNYINAMLYYNYSRRLDRLFYIKKGFLFAFLFYCLVSVFFLVVAHGLVSEYRIEILFFTCSFVLAGYASVLLRIEKRSDLIFRLSRLDLIASTFLLFFVVYSEEFGFIFILSAFKEIAKTLFVFVCLKKELLGGDRNSDRHRMVLRVYSISHVFRSSYQVLSQHADRFIFPFLFGLTVGGQAAIGSSFAMILVSLSSSAFLWALPSTVRNEDMTGYILAQWRKLIFAASCLSGLFWIFLDYIKVILSVYFPSFGSISTITISSFLFSSLLGVSFILSLLDKKRLKSLEYFVFSLGVVVATYLTVFILVWSIGFSIDKAMILGVVVFVVLILLYNRKYFSCNDYMVTAFSISVMCLMLVV